MTFTEAYLANTQAFLLDTFTVQAYQRLEKDFPANSAIPSRLVSRHQIQQIVLEEAGKFCENYSRQMMEVEQSTDWLVDTFMSNWN